MKLNKVLKPKTINVSEDVTRVETLHKVGGNATGHNY